MKHTQQWFKNRIGKVVVIISKISNGFIILGNTESNYESQINDGSIFYDAAPEISKEILLPICEVDQNNMPEGIHPVKFFYNPGSFIEVTQPDQPYNDENRKGPSDKVQIINMMHGHNLYLWQFLGFRFMLCNESYEEMINTGAIPFVDGDKRWLGRDNTKDVEVISMENLYLDIGSQGKRIFPDAGPIDCLNKMKDEADEAIEEPDNIIEYADCLIALFHASFKAGFTYGELEKAVSKKVKINEKRNWKKNSNGTYSHV